MDENLRSRLYGRSRGYCELCGFPMTKEQSAVHHRKLRSQGGEDSMVNCMAVHHSCHNGKTDSIHLQVADALTNGWLVASWERPDNKPLLLHRKKWVRLSENGGYYDGVPCLECGVIKDSPMSARVCAFDDKARADDLMLTEPEGA